MEARKPDFVEYLLIIGLDSGERAVFISDDPYAIEQEKQIIESRISVAEEPAYILPLDSRKWFLNGQRHIRLYYVNLHNIEYLALSDIGEVE